MNKSELITAVAEKSGLAKKDAEKAVKAVMETVVTTVAAGAKVQIVGFGTFAAHERKARQGKNPQTGAVMEIAASTVPSFKAGKAFKDAVNVPKKKTTKKAKTTKAAKTTKTAKTTKVAKTTKKTQK